MNERKTDFLDDVTAVILQFLCPVSAIQFARTSNSAIRVIKESVWKRARHPPYSYCVGSHFPVGVNNIFGVAYNISPLSMKRQKGCVVRYEITLKIACGGSGGTDKILRLLYTNEGHQLYNGEVPNDCGCYATRGSTFTIEMIL